MSTRHNDAQEFRNRIVQRIRPTEQLQLVDADSLDAGQMGGLYTISGSAPATVTLPAASDCAGAEVIFKNASDQLHILSGTALTFSDGSAGTDTGTVLTMGGLLDNSVVLKSDGSRYLVTAASGTVAFS